MTESSLSQIHTSFRLAISYYLGWGIDSTAWTSAQTTNMDRWIKDALNRFYSEHDWMFLTPTTTRVLWSDKSGTLTGLTYVVGDLSTALVSDLYDDYVSEMIGYYVTFGTSGNTYAITGQDNITGIAATHIGVSGDASGEVSTDTITITSGGDFSLPDDFGTVFGPIYFDTVNDSYHSIASRTLGEVFHHRQLSTTTGIPREYALHPQSTTGAASQKMRLAVWPTPDQDYTVRLRYEAFPNVTDASTYTYPWGASKVSHAIQCCCVATAAQANGEPDADVKEAEYQRELAKAIAFDNRRRPSNLGYNGDGSVENAPGYKLPGSISRTLNGTTYTFYP